MSTAKKGARSRSSSDGAKAGGDARANDAAKHNPELGARAIDGDVEEDAVDSVDGALDIGSASQLPGAEDGKPVKAVEIPKPTKENAPLDATDAKAVQSRREEAHERADKERAQGHGAEAPRFNPGATP